MIEEKLNLTDYKNCIAYYDYYKNVNNEYELILDDDIVPANKSTLLEEGLAEIKYDENDTPYILVSQEAIDRFYPNNINNKDFWKLSKQKFPLLSMSGLAQKNIEDVNTATLNTSKMLNLYPTLRYIIEKYDTNVLEIGYGYGNLFNEIKDECNYVGIDYTKPKELEEYDNLLTIDKSGIPELKDKPNIIYSCNVFQHCSQKDRFDYIRQSYDILGDSGILMFSCFCMTDENKDDEYMWGLRDENGRGYCVFFNQLTEVDYDYELKDLLNEVGFKIDSFEVYPNTNCLAVIVRK